MLADARQIHKAIDGAEQIILRDVVFYRELVKQRALRLLLRSHHRHQSPASTRKLNQ
jgi:hypothetical protein